MVGVFTHTLPDFANRRASELFDAARDFGFDAVLLHNILVFAPDLDPGRLEELRSDAAARGLRLTIGVSFFNPVFPDLNAPLARLGNGDPVAGLERVLRAASRLGAATVYFMIGTNKERTDEIHPWAMQVQAVVDAIRGLAPAIRESGVRLLIKTHEEVTSTDILGIVEAVGADLLGVAHDPVNAFCRMEEPVEATRRIARHVAQVHLDDAFVTFEGDRMRRYLTPIGTGDIDWPALLALVPDATLWVEHHKGQFLMPVFDKDWLAAQPDTVLDEYRSLLARAFRQADRRVPDQSRERLTATLDWLRATGRL